MMPSWNQVVGFLTDWEGFGGWRHRIPMPVHRVINSTLGNNGREIRPWLAVWVAARSARNGEDPGALRARTSDDDPTLPQFITRNACR
jgi:hypothetical protein